MTIKHVALSSVGKTMMLRGYASTSFGQIHYYNAGEGEPLILLHATPRSGRIFSRLIPLLADRFNVYAFDTPGFGSSDSLPAKVTMDGLANVLTEAMDALSISTAHFLGYHTGNKIAAALAANAPDRVRKLILVGMSHSLVAERSGREAAIHALVDKSLHNSNSNSAELLRRWATAFTSISETWWRPEVLSRTELSEEDLVDLEREVLDKLQARISVDAIYRANFEFDFESAIERIAAPSLILELATAQEQKLRGAGESIRQRMRQAALQVFDNTDRSVWERQPKLIAESVLEFLTGSADRPQREVHETRSTER